MQELGAREVTQLTHELGFGEATFAVGAGVGEAFVLQDLRAGEVLYALGDFWAIILE